MAIRNADLGGIDYQDTGSTLLNGALTDSATTVTVDSTTGFKSGGGTIRIGTELIDYTGVTATTFTGCTRGQYGTTATSHSDNAEVEEREVVKAADLNDTFDAAVNKVQTLTAFWLNSELYDVYDDFDSYSTSYNLNGDSKWTVSGSGTATVSATTQAGGSGKEAKLECSTTTSQSVDLTGDSLSANKHFWCRGRITTSLGHNAGGEVNGNIKVRIGSSSFYTILIHKTDNSSTTTNSNYFDIFIVAQGSNIYDIYAGGFKIADGITEPTFNVTLQASVGGGDSSNTVSTTVYIDDVRQSKGTV